MFKSVAYSDLNARQQENYNFQKVAAKLADYGFNCLRLSDDWQGADFIAFHIDGETVLKVQLKGRLAIAKKYIGKEIYIAFLHGVECFVFPHDEFLTELIERGSMEVDSKVWRDDGHRSWPKTPNWAFDWLEKYRI